MNKIMISFLAIGITFAMIISYSLKFESIEIKSVNAQKANNTILKGQEQAQDYTANKVPINIVINNTKSAGGYIISN